MFGLFKKKDAICGMKEENDKGIAKNGEWFCSKDCLSKYEKQLPKKDSHQGHSCCH